MIDLSPEFIARMMDDWVFDPTISKHGSHDQKSHGNWARGGGGSSPAVGGYREALLASASKSRTFRGEIDVSGSKGKADLFANDLTPKLAASRSQANFNEQFDAVAAKAKSGFKDGDDVLRFFDGINEGLNKGILKPDAPTLRQGNSEKFPYTDVSKLGAARRQFAAEFLSRLDKGDPIETAAWVHWRMNFTDHFYADAVGRTTEMAVATVLMRHGLPIPKAPDKATWYAKAAKHQRTPDGTGKTYLGEDYEEFVGYYRTLFDGVSKHGDGSHDETSHGNWARGGGVSIPLPPGKTPIPEGTHRMYHVTSPEVAAKIREEGFKLSSGRGDTYGEPNAIWFSNKTDYWKMGAGTTLIEVALPDEWGDPMKNTVGGFTGNMAIGWDIEPKHIVAVHEQWHRVYQELKSDPVTQQAAREGLYDSMLDDPMYGPAFRQWFAEEGIEKHYPGRHDQKTHGSWAAGRGIDVSDRGVQGSLFPDLVEPDVTLTAEELDEFKNRGEVILAVNRGKRGVHEVRTREITEEMRQRWENRQPTEDDVAAIFEVEFEVNGIRVGTKVEDVRLESWNPNMGVSAAGINFSLIDLDTGSTIATVERHLNLNASVSNASFFVRRQYKHQGIGLTALMVWEHNLSHTGVFDTMEVEAVDDGVYVWPMYGYEFKYPPQEFSAYDTISSSLWETWSPEGGLVSTDADGYKTQEFMDFESEWYANFPTVDPTDANIREVVKVADGIMNYGETYAHDIVTAGGGGEITDIGAAMMRALVEDGNTTNELYKEIWHYDLDAIEKAETLSRVHERVFTEWMLKDAVAVETLAPRYTKALKKARDVFLATVSKHTPGGHDHDQQSHGNRAGVRGNHPGGVRNLPVHDRGNGQHIVGHEDWGLRTGPINREILKYLWMPHGAPKDALKDDWERELSRAEDRGIDVVMPSSGWKKPVSWAGPQHLTNLKSVLDQHDYWKQRGLDAKPDIVVLGGSRNTDQGHVNRASTAMHGKDGNLVTVLSWDKADGLSEPGQSFQTDSPIASDRDKWTYLHEMGHHVEYRAVARRGDQVKYHYEGERLSPAYGPLGSWGSRYADVRNRQGKKSEYFAEAFVAAFSGKWELPEDLADEVMAVYDTSISKHTPGGHEHDQMSHGRRSGGTAVMDRPPQEVFNVLNDPTVWTRWGTWLGVEAIRNAAAELTGGPKWEAGSRYGSQVPNASHEGEPWVEPTAKALLTALDQGIGGKHLKGFVWEGEETTPGAGRRRLWRGVKPGLHESVTEFYARAESLQPGDKMGFALASFTPSFNVAAEFTKVSWDDEPIDGSRIILSVEGPVKVVGETEGGTYQLKGGEPFELITGGEFTVLSNEIDQYGWRIINLRQDDTYSVSKTDVWRIDPVLGGTQPVPPESLLKHYPGLHDQSSHGNWATGALTVVKARSINVDHIRETEPKLADKLDAKIDKVYGGYEVVRQNYKTLLMEVADSPEARAYKEWYTDVHKLVTNISATQRIDQKALTGIAAAVSSGMEWNQNRMVVEAIATLMSDGVVPKSGIDLIARIEPLIDRTIAVPYGTDPFDKAAEMMGGADPAKVLGGPKIRSFYNNLLAMDNDPNVTIDSHMIRAAAFDPKLDITQGIRGTPGRSKTVAGKTVASDALGVLPGLAKVVTDLTSDPDVVAAWGDLQPRQVQSIIWSNWVDNYRGKDVDDA